MFLNNKHRPIVLTIAASDSAGMAGISTDLKTQQAFGIHSMLALTATTAQNNFEVVAINPVDVVALKEQLEAVKSLPICVVKVGLIANIEQARVIAKFIMSSQLPLILDPVLSASSGKTFFKSQDIAAYVDVLLPLCSLVTPNLKEASLLTNLGVDSAQEIELAAESMLLFGAQHVLIKGGHAEEEYSDYCQDYFASDDKCFWLSSERKLSRNTRGTGCALASVVASCIAHGTSMEDAVVIAKMAINQGIAQSYSVAESKGPIDIASFPVAEKYLPIVSCQATDDLNRLSFPKCDDKPLGLYPVVERAIWLKKLLPLGITTIQLRIKDLRGEALTREIKKAVEIANQFDCRLFINDYWEQAIELGAYGVHLGQEDLESADIEAIYSAGLRLGVSTHCHHEVARAIRLKPSYIACGPVYHTDSKAMPWTPQGLNKLNYWRQSLNYPLVAIGGINASRIADVAATKVSGIAMISAITEADDPLAQTQRLLTIIEQTQYKKILDKPSEDLAIRLNQREAVTCAE
ncbi:thiamine phosphate synthase [Aliikangiella sp. IMCC44632]